MGGKCVAAVVVAAVVGATSGYIKGYRNADQSATLQTQARRIRELVRERDESERIARQQQGNAEDARKKRDQALVDAVAAASAAERLRKQLAAYVERARHSAASAGSPATGDALDLLADVLGRTSDAATELADYADRARIAGQQCERDYDALNGNPQVVSAQ
ncbi:DUF2514 family protein [Burkholderia dolosa]|uniref:DUF2514 family protein n=1 Tax=Burkholderia dolosa TaxID=152500 RepID=UPI001B9F9D83|nr:DUF2514 family protein [Burkholderia dolosa]MBR8317286.1 DUF2514 family protein [Burkholderia dolosa]